MKFCIICGQGSDRPKWLREKDGKVACDFHTQAEFLAKLDELKKLSEAAYGVKPPEHVDKPLPPQGAVQGLQGTAQEAAASTTRETQGAVVAAETEADQQAKAKVAEKLTPDEKIPTPPPSPAAGALNSTPKGADSGNTKS